MSFTVKPNYIKGMEVPEEIVTSVCEYLEPKDLKKCEYVNSFWKKATQNESIWKLQYPQNVKDYCAPLIEKKIIFHRDICEFKEFPQFLDRIKESFYNRDKEWLEKENPHLDNVLLFDGVRYPELILTKGFVSYGNCEFSIQNSINIKLKNGEKESILMGEEGKTLSHLCVTDDILYVLRQDGLIISWDYKNEKSIGCVETAYYQKNEKVLKEIAKSIFKVPETLDVQNGYIVVKHGNNQCKVLEMISCSNLNSRRLFIDNAINMGRIHVIGNSCYLQTFINRVSFWDFTTGNRDSVELFKSTNGPNLTDVAIKGATFYGCDTSKNLYVGSKKQISKYKTSMEIKIVTVVSGLIFGFDSKGHINVINQNGKTLEIVEGVIENKKIAPGVMEKLVKACIKHRGGESGKKCTIS